MLILGNKDSRNNTRTPGISTTYACVCKARANGQITKAYAMLKKQVYNYPSRVVIYNSSGQIVENGISNTATIPGADNVWNLIEFTFPTPVSISSGETYWMALFNQSSGWIEGYTGQSNGHKITQTGTFASPGSCYISETSVENLSLWLEYEPTGPITTYTIGGILGSNTPSVLKRDLWSGQNYSHNVLIKVTPSSDFEIQFIAFYAEDRIVASSGQINIGILTGNTITTILNGWAASVPSTPSGFRWWYYYPVNKPILSANILYSIAIASGRFSVAYITSTNTYNTHGYSDNYGMDEPNRLFSIYASGNYISSNPGPSLKIEGITPGKLEGTAWSNISTIR